MTCIASFNSTACSLGAGGAERALDSKVSSLVGWRAGSNALEKIMNRYLNGFMFPQFSLQQIQIHNFECRLGHSLRIAEPLFQTGAHPWGFLQVCLGNSEPLAGGKSQCVCIFERFSSMCEEALEKNTQALLCSLSGLIFIINCIKSVPSPTLNIKYLDLEMTRFFSGFSIERLHEENFPAHCSVSQGNHGLAAPEKLSCLGQDRMQQWWCI